MPESRRNVGPPDRYLADVATHVRRLALSGRGEDVRGRNLLALHVLEAGYAHGWVSYTPHRDVGRWLVMLLDLVGARVGLGPRARVDRTLAELLDDLRATGLRRLADVTGEVVASGVARGFGWPALALAPVVPRMSVGAALWHVDFRVEDYRSQVHFEKHSQGKLIRRKLAATLDELWAEAAAALPGSGPPSALHVLAALPPSFPVVLKQVEGSLARVEESLAALPFAVFYALVTDAARTGRRWRPPDPYVEGRAYNREDFQRAVGRQLTGSGSRRGRYRRSVALAELGLSSFFPATVALLDGWLAGCTCSELWVEPPEGAHAGWREGWLDTARDRLEAIEDLQWRLYASVTELLRRGAARG